MSFFLDGFFTTSNSPQPGKIVIEVPIYDMSSKEYQTTHVSGLLASEPTFVTQNKWGPIISDVSNLTDLGSLLNSSDLFSWVHASTLCWKGTEPIKFSVDFYLINYSQVAEATNSSALNYFTSLTALGVSPKGGGLLEGALVSPHGGYATEIFADNSGSSNYFSGVSALKKGEYNVSLSGTAERLYGSTKGTATVYIGTNKVIPKVLVSRTDVTPSLVEVPSGNPLYYRVGASFTGNTSLTIPESNYIFSS